MGEFCCLQSGEISDDKNGGKPERLLVESTKLLSIVQPDHENVETLQDASPGQISELMSDLESTAPLGK